MDTKSDFNIITDGRWLSPHYDHHYSSIPRKIAQLGYTVTINEQCKDNTINILVVNSYADLEALDCATTKNIVLGLPGSEIRLPGGQHIKPQSIPLGFSNIAIDNTELFVKDSRGLLTKDGIIANGPIILDQSYIIGTGSPSDIDFSKLIK